MSHAKHSEKNRSHRGVVLALAALAVLAVAAGPAAFALEPPPPGHLEQLRKEGTLAEAVKAAEAFGNHKMNPRLLWDANNRLQELVTGKAPEDVMTPPPAWQGGLPASGNVKVLALFIAFSDMAPVSADTQAKVTGQLFGDGSGGYPMESLRNFYQRSSYNALTIGGNALGWYTTSYPRSSVTQTTTGRENLIKEALTYYNNQGHDFSQYDNNGDGIIDYFLVVWTGAHGNWATFWWGYNTNFQDSSYTLDGKRLGNYSWQWESYSYPSGSFSPDVVIHETGHSLGLPDYYDYDGSQGPDGGVGGLDQMDGNWGDHNCFSKFVLNWITPTVYSSGAAHTVSLHPSSSSQDALIIMPSVSSSAFQEYFMVQSRNRQGNDSTYPTDGLLIWHVDARLDGSGWDYLYDNSYTSHKLLRLMEADGLEEIEQNGSADAGDYYLQGKSFGPSTTPNSKRYDGTQTNVSVSSISAYADPMTFTASLGGGGGAVPTVTGLVPNSGPKSGGTGVTITGTDFTGATAVKFGNRNASAFTVNSATQITATSPMGSGTVYVTVTTPAGTSATGTACRFTYQALTAPVVNSLSPSSGPAAGGTTVTITGVNLSGATAVKFGAVSATSYTVNSSTQITAVSPAQAAGGVYVTVTTSSGTSSASAGSLFTYTGGGTGPAVTGLSPTSGPTAGGTSVTVTGANFSGATAVQFGGASATSFTVNSATQITAVSPAGSGTVHVTVTTAQGTSTPTAADQFTYTSGSSPVITGLSPNSGLVSGGTGVIITGTGFTGATAVKFGTTPAKSFRVMSATQIRAVSPAGNGTVYVTVTTPGGTSAQTAASQYTYH